MARKRVVSRTIVCCDCVAMTVDTESAEVENKGFTIKHKVNRGEALKEAKKLFENDTCKVVAVVEVVENLYKAVMDEEKFLDLADVEKVEVDA